MTIALTIGGRSYTTVKDTVSIENLMTYEIDQLICRVRAPDDLPGDMEEVILTDGAVKKFAGILVDKKLANKKAKEWDLTVFDYTPMIDRRLVAETYTNKSASDIMADLIAKYCPGFSAAGVVTGAPAIEEISFSYKRPSECFKKICEYIAWQWYVDSDKTIHFLRPEDVISEAPMKLNEANRGRFWGLVPKISSKNVVNRVYVLGGTMLSDVQTIKWKADGEARQWVLPWGPHEISYDGTAGKIGVGGTAQKIGVEYLTDEGAVDYLLNYTEKYIRASEGTTTSADGTVMEFDAKQGQDVITQVEDINSQIRIAALQGGDGIYEGKIEDKNISNLEAAEAAGQAKLRAEADPAVTVPFVTEVGGWAPGQLLEADLADRGLVNTYMVQRVRQKYIDYRWIYEVEAGGRLITLADFLQALISANAGAEVQTEKISKIVTGTERSVITDELTLTPRALPFICGDLDAICGFVEVAT